MIRLLTFLFLAAPLAAAQTSGPSTVSLRYGWEPGMRGTMQVSGTRFETGTTDGEMPPAVVTYALAVDKHVGGGLQVSRRVLSTDISNVAAFTLFDPAALIQQMTPTLIVAEGELVGLANGAELVTQARRLIASSVDLDSLVAANPAAGGAIDAMLSEATFLQGESMWWNVAVGFWMGAELEIGELYSTSYEQPIATMGGVTVPFVSEFTATEWAPCTEAETVPRCVWLEVDSYVDDEAFARAMETFMAQFGEIESLGPISGGSGGTVLLDPATLRPYEVITSKTFQLEDPEVEGGIRTREDIMSYVFTWQKGR